MIYGSKIGKRFVDASLETCRVDADNKKAAEFAKQVVSGELDGLILQGPVGSGKTHLMMAIINDIEKAKAPVLREMEDGTDSFTRPCRIFYWKAPDFATALRESFADATNPGRDAREAEYLFIDDLGTEYEKAGSDFVFASLQAVFDYRWENKMMIVVTTNMEAPALAKRYGDRVLSRWRGQCKFLSLKGADRRKEFG